MTRKRLGDRPLTAAEKQARYRARKAAGAVPARIAVRRPVDRRSRPQRWQEAVCELVEIQASCQEWLDRLPESLAGTSTGETLEAICALDLAELETVQPPMGFGRD